MTPPRTISRRRLLAGLAGVPLASLAALAPPSRPMRRTTFVLVHGAWHGGWCWRKLTPLLRAAGHAVLTPTLTGLGDRAHLLNPGIDLDTHIQDVAALLEFEDLQEVVLVGHSYGGMVISGVAAKARARLSQLVYLDALLPENGKAATDYITLDPAKDDAWRVPPPGPPSAFGVTNDRDAEWMARRLRDQPRKTFTQPIRLAGGNGTWLPSTFIQCTDLPFAAAAGMRAKRLGYSYRALFAAGHDAMVTQPLALANMLVGHPLP